MANLIGVEDRGRIERWFVANGVPSFIERDGRTKRPVRWAAGACGATVALLVALALVGVDIDHSAASVTASIAATLVVGAIAYLIVASGIVFIAIFAVRFFLDSLRSSRATMLSVLPLLLVAVTFFFLATETWQTIGRLHGLPLVLTGLLFASITLAVVARQVAPDLTAAGAFADVEDLARALPKWLAPAAQPTALSGSAGDDLRRSERRNLRTVAALAQITVAVIVGFAVFVFFIVFGLFTVPIDVVTAWAGEPAVVWLRVDIASHDYAITSQHARVATFLGVFSAFYFVVSAASNETLRAGLSEGAEVHARACLAVRAVYRDVVRGS